MSGDVLAKKLNHADDSEVTTESWLFTLKSSMFSAAKEAVGRSQLNCFKESSDILTQ